MSLMWLVYLADIVNALHEIISVIGIVMLIAFVFLGIGYVIDDDFRDRIEMILSRALILVAIMFPLAILVPQKETIYIMIATNYGEELAKNQKVQALGDKVYKIVNEKLDAIIEAAPKKVDSK